MSVRNKFIELFHISFCRFLLLESVILLLSFDFEDEAFLSSFVVRVTWFAHVSAQE